jgi:hypothetical protein
MFRPILLTLVWAALLVWLVGIAPFCWLLRDGLGPRAVQSSGWSAVVRFLLTFYWGPIALALLWLAGVEVVWWWLRKDSDSIDKDE